MSDIEIALGDYLITYVPQLNGNVFNGALPNGKQMPCATYHKLSGGRRIMCHDGASGLVLARFQIDIWSDIYAQASEIASDILTLLDGYSGEMGIDPVTIYAIFADNQYRGFQTDVPLQNVILQATIFYHE